MDREELEKYEYQLAQVKLALAKDPSNEEYLSLQTELSDLISLTREYLDSAAPSTAPAESSTASSSSTSKPAKPKSSKPSTSSTSTPTGSSTPTPSHNLKSGDECLARFSGDGKFYPARITSVGGADAHRVFSVVFHEYDSTEILNAGDVKPLTDSKKRALELSAEEIEKEKRRKKNEKKEDNRQVKAAEQVSKQKSWQSFAKKGAKKGAKGLVPGISGTSMFRSPDDGNPNAKVGVVGSGRGMTASVERKRQTFRED